MSLEENKAIARRYWEELWNKEKQAVADEIIAPNFVFYLTASPEPLRGPEGIKRFVSDDHIAYPDLKFTIDEQIAEGDSVATRWTMRGTHLGQWTRFPPTGKQVEFSGITIFRIVDGKIVEGRAFSDVIGLLRQLGVMPTS